LPGRALLGYPAGVQINTPSRATNRRYNIMADVRTDVEKALEEIRPMLQADGGDVELIDVDENNVVKVRLTGACGGCPMAMMTLKQGIERRLKSEVPEVDSVEPVTE
jgi:Fe-S cluster biogenesis protein NfuA